MNLRELIGTLRDEGYSQANAEARVCQDVVLKAIDESAFSNHITIKGGVVMRSITGDARRARNDRDGPFRSPKKTSCRLALSQQDALHFFLKTETGKRFPLSFSYFPSSCRIPRYSVSSSFPVVSQ